MSNKIGIFGKVKGLEAYNHHPTPKRPRPKKMIRQTGKKNTSSKTLPGNSCFL